MSSPTEHLVDDISGPPEPKFALQNGELPAGTRDRPTLRRYRAVAWLTVAAGLAYLCRNAVGVSESTIREELGLTLEQSGWFMGAFFWTYAIFQVPSGWFSERVGTRIALSLFALSWSLATLGMGVLPGFWLLVVAQLIMGVAQAGLLPATCNSIGHWMPIAERSSAIGILGAGMGIGAVAATGVTSALIGPLGWQLVFVALALPGIVWTFGFFARFRDDPTEVLPPDSTELALIRSGRSSDNSSVPNKRGETSEILEILSTSTIWWLCGQQMCRSAGYMFFASWFPTFLQTTRDVTIEESGRLQGVVLAGPLLGGILGGLLTDWIWRRTQSLRISRSGVGATALVSCSLMILGAWFVESTGFAVFLLALSAFFAAFAGPCAFAATIDIGGPRVPQIAGLMNMSGNLAAGATPVLVAKLIQLTANWNLVLLVFAGVFVAGAICWLFVNPQQRVREVAI
jgi:ACS family glucarate transporter-like MFS transporter/ACS family D-galactonate transporter-like MFS transporter